MRPGPAIQDCFGAGELHTLLPARAGRAAWTSSFLDQMLSAHFSPQALLGRCGTQLRGDGGPVPELPVSL